LDAFQALLKSRPTVNPTADWRLLAAARAELAKLCASHARSSTQRKTESDNERELQLRH
jgi:hypothetical protein